MNRFKIHLTICACLFAFLVPQTAVCEMMMMDDYELSGIYAEGFADFKINTISAAPDIQETYAWFNIHTYQYTTIDSLKLGYHDEYKWKDPNPGFGWDQDWEGVTLGGDIEDPSQDLHTEGVYFKAEFENIDTPATRELKSITFGADYISGEISANFIDFSGTIDDSNDNTPEFNGHALNLGLTPITPEPDGDGLGSSFEMSFSIDNYDKGYWINFTNATVTP